MRLHKLAIDRAGFDPSVTLTDGPSHKVFEYEKNGKKRYGFYVTDGFLGIPTDWRFRFKTKRAAHDACLKMVAKTTPSVQERVLRDLRRVGHWIDVSWFAKKYSVSRGAVVNASKILKNKGLIESETRFKDGKQTYHLRAIEL